jgi:ubiquinol-cytochrome c reductase cytochrome b subunit
MMRALLYGSYRKPRELIWLFGVAIFLCLMGEAFFGYLLPWGQMSYWGAQVIVNLFGAIPFIGPDLSLWIRGDYVVSDATLNRFFAFHVIAIPLVLLGLVVAHLIALHEVGSNNPDGIEVKDNLGPDGNGIDTIPSHPYYSTKDIFGVSVFLFIFSAVEGASAVNHVSAFLEDGPNIVGYALLSGTAQGYIAGTPTVNGVLIFAE